MHSTSLMIGTPAGDARYGAGPWAVSAATLAGSRPPLPSAAPDTDPASIQESLLRASERIRDRVTLVTRVREAPEAQPASPRRRQDSAAAGRYARTAPAAGSLDTLAEAVRDRVSLSGRNGEGLRGAAAASAYSRAADAMPAGGALETMANEVTDQVTLSAGERNGRRSVLELLVYLGKPGRETEGEPVAVQTLSVLSPSPG